MAEMLLGIACIQSEAVYYFAISVSTSAAQNTKYGISSFFYSNAEILITEYGFCWLQAVAACLVHLPNGQ